MSKEELIHDNDRLVAEVSRLKVGLDEVHEMFVNLEKAFVESKASFSLSRYGELKDMIKNVTSDETLKKVHSLTENQADGKKGGLMNSAKTFSQQTGEGACAREESQAPASKAGKALSGFFRKIKDVTGFSDDPVGDIRCLDKEDIRQDNQRKRREIQRLNTRGLRAYNRLEQLQRRYQASKSFTPPSRYQELKDMIKDIISDQAL